jgi:hypothetical protein
MKQLLPEVMLCFEYQNNLYSDNPKVTPEVL